MAFDGSKVSIILPVHNQESYLKACVKSLLSQTHKDLEIIAIDDKSTDSSFSILKSFARKDKRLKLFRNKKHYGLAVCFNRALKRGRGQFVAFMDARDTSAPNRIATQFSYLQKNQKIAVVGTQCKFVGPTNKTLGKTDLPHEHIAIYQKLQGLSLQFESVMVNRMLLPKDVLYFRKHTYPFIYIDVFMQVLKYGQAANLKQYLHYRRQLDQARLSVKHVQSFFRVMGKTFATNEYKPSLRTLFSPLVNA